MRAALDINPIYKCAVCQAAVYLVSNPQKRFFFRHRQEDGSCPAITRGSLSQEEIRARKYRGLQESEPHKLIKNLIERSLRADSKFQQESVLQEKRIYLSEERDKWRQPDIQALYGKQRIAFEAQLSTTFLDVVVGRRTDYSEAGTQLVWILAAFDADDRRLTTDDILFSNNSNIFVVDEETCRLSEERGAFHLRCHHREPYVDCEAVKERWTEKIVRFSDVILDLQKQQAYFFDFEAVENELQLSLDEELRNDFLRCWCSEASPTPNDAQLNEWTGLRKRLAERNISVPVRPDDDSNFTAMINGVLSATDGEPVGWHFQKLIQVAHHLAEKYPQHLLAFGYALKWSGNSERIRQQDRKGSWATRGRNLRKSLEQKDERYIPDQEWLEALCFLFPEIGARITSFLGGLKRAA